MLHAGAIDRQELHPSDQIGARRGGRRTARRND